MCGVLNELVLRGFAKLRNSKKLDNYGSGWAGAGLNRKKVENSPILALIFGGDIPCVFCVYICY